MFVHLPAAHKLLEWRENGESEEGSSTCVEQGRHSDNEDDGQG